MQTGGSGFEQRVAVRACAHECASTEVCGEPDRWCQGHTRCRDRFPGEVFGWSASCKLGQSPAGRHVPTRRDGYLGSRLRHGFVLCRLVVGLSDVGRLISVSVSNRILLTVSTSLMRG